MADRIPLGSAPRANSGPGAQWFGWNNISAFAKACAANVAAEQERWFPWAVVGFGAGIAAYFGLGNEPPPAAAAIAAGAGLACIAARWKISSALNSFLLLLAAAALFGFADAQLRTQIVAAPVIAKDLGPVRVTGRIEDVEIRAPDRARLVIAVSRIEGLQSPPAYVRLTISGSRGITEAKPGAVLSALATLRSPPEPAMPNGYDFARWAWFQGIGGVGFIYGTPRVLSAPPPGLLERLNSRLDDLRLSMTSRIERAIPGADRSIAAALITGERGEIDPDDNQAYRDSGLAHVLSISGVHLALAGLGVFWVLRALLALWPRVALSQPIKKWAAAGAFLGSTFYLAVSGGGSPADRSWLILSIMLLGVMLDRPALSMRSVAMAALVILIFQPEDVVDPSFQMSFGAVIGLIALAEWQSGRRSGLPEPASRFGRAWRKLRVYVLGALAVSTVATLATTPMAIYHFDRAAFYSLLANLLAEPVVAFVIMPAAAIAVVLMPFGLELLPLRVMGWGVHAMSAIAHWVAGLPGATTMVRSWPVAALAIMIFGGLWIALWRQKWRWFGLIPVAAAVLLIMVSSTPDLLIARDLRSAAVRGQDGKLIVVGERPDPYTASQWLIRDGDRRDLAAARSGAHCDEIGCVAFGMQGMIVAIAGAVSALPEDCTRARIVISSLRLHGKCRGPDLLVDHSDTDRNGALAISFRSGHTIVETVASDRGNRPWARAFSAEVTAGSAQKMR
jgi:competence protein ComEC